MEPKFSGKEPRPASPGGPPPKRAGDFEGPGRTHHVQKKDRYDLDIRSYSGAWKLFDAFNCRYLEDVVYCETPLNQDLQCMNLFIPKAYINADGTVNPDAACGAYTASTAPIVFQSAVMGYSEVDPAMLRENSDNPDQKLSEQFLEAGMIYVSVGVRGRQTKGEDGSYVGKAPALLVDTKAAIRFYRHNRAALPGDTERIIFVGVSAGGNLASLTGTTGDDPYFTETLRQIGAVQDESDAVYAIQSFCPITDLSHADMAYEWMFHGRYERDVPPFLKDPNGGRMTPFQRALSDALGERYLAYINGLGLTHPVTGEALTLNADARSGPFYDYLLGKLEDSAAKYLRYLEEGSAKVPARSVEDYLSGNFTIPGRRPGAPEKPGLDKRSWLSWDGQRAHITSLDAMEDAYVKRMKGCPSFDSLELAEFENEEFGPADQERSHFSPALAEVLASLKDAFPEEYARYYPALAAAAEDPLLKEQNYALDPLRFIPKGTGLCQHYRIRVGSMDPHTSFSTALLVALSLMNAGKDVDFAFTWEAGHGVCDYDGELRDWIQSIC